MLVTFQQQWWFLQCNILCWYRPAFLQPMGPVPFPLRLRRLILQHIFVHRCTWTLPPHHFTPAHVKNYCTAHSECLQKIKGWNTAVRCTLQRLYWCVPAMLRMQSYLRNEMLAWDWQNEIQVSFLKECIVGFVGKKKVLCPSKTFYWQSWYTTLLCAQEQSKLTGFTVLKGHELCTVYDIQSNQSQLQINWSAARMRAILISYSIKQSWLSIKWPIALRCYTCS